MPDAHFEHPRLVAIHDALEPERPDLLPYLDLAAGAGSVLDVGCGTGTFALLLAARGAAVTAVDPAAGSLAVARAKPGADRVRWLHGDATTLPPMRADLAVLTGNVAQAIHEPPAWQATLRGVHAALREGGRLVFETRDPAFRAWTEWNRAGTYRVDDLPGAGRVETWTEVVDVSGPLVTFVSHFAFADETLTSTSTLRFRERAEVEADLAAAGYLVEDVREAPDRPGREFVFVARTLGSC